MFEKVPTRFWVLAIVGVLLSGPLVVYSFLFAGPAIGAMVLLGVVFYFVVLYMIAVRRYSQVMYITIV